MREMKAGEVMDGRDRVAAGKAGRGEKRRQVRCLLPPYVGQLRVGTAPGVRAGLVPQKIVFRLSMANEVKLHRGSSIQKVIFTTKAPGRGGV